MTRGRFAGARACVAALVAVLLLAAPAAAAQGAADVSVYVAGIRVPGATVEAGRVLVPVRGLADALGLTLRWDPAARTAVLAGAGHPVVLRPGTARAEVDGAAITLEAPAVLRAGRLYAPLRALAEAAGLRVTWDARARAVRVELPVQPAAWREVDPSDLPPGLRAVLDEELARGEPRSFRTASERVGGTLYLLLVWAHLPTAGYDLRVLRVSQVGGTALVEVAFVEPPPGAATAQVITHVVRALAIEGASAATVIPPAPPRR